MDPLLSKIKLKALEEIIAAARETIHRHRRKFLQRNLRPCPENCKGASMVGHKVVGCTNCGSPNSDTCIKEDKFVPLFSKEELAQQFADQLRNPEVLLREYRDVTVFLWVLGAFDKQKKEIDETIVEKVEQSENKIRKMAAGQAGVGGGDARVRDVRQSRTEPDDSEAGARTRQPIADNGQESA
jgi:hypothetical protein